MDDRLIPDLLERYFANEVSADERSVVMAWAARRSENARLLHAMGQLWSEARRGGTKANVDHAWNAFLVRQRAASIPSRTGRISSGLVRDRIAYRWIGVGAAACVAIAGIALGTLPRARTAEQTYTTSTGERATVMLRNGARIQLAPQTRITVAENIVRLSGEALFTVQHRVDAPLIVHTAATTTRVLGTAFDVRHYDGDQATRVVVLEGRVATGVARLVPLSAHQVAIVTNDSVVTTSSANAVDAATAWTNGRFIFRDATVGDVLSTIERWYGVTFHLAEPSLAARVVTTTVDTQRSRTETLAVLEAILDVRMTSVGDTISIIPRRTPTRFVAPSAVRDQLLTPIQEKGR